MEGASAIPVLMERQHFAAEDSRMVISVSRAKDGAGLTLRTSKDGEDDYEVTVQPGESALGYTYEEWDGAVGPQAEGRIEVAEDGLLRPASDQFEAPADGHA
jgi:hypothetical protein